MRRLVPVEMTQAMIDAAMTSGFEGTEEHLRADWAAILDAVQDDEPIPYRITPAGREHLDGGGE